MNSHEGVPAPDDLELSALENDAFLPNEGATSTKLKRKPSILTRWMPVRARKFAENLSRIKVVIIILVFFIAMLAFLGSINNSIKPISIPKESLALSTDLAKRFANTTIPKYVLEYAPLVFLDKEDKFYPSDLGLHLARTHPTVNFSSVDVATPGLADLDTLNGLGGEEVYLTSNENLATIPQYLYGQAPNKKTLQTEKAVSAVIIVVEKDEGIVDAFYMYFYTFNQGPSVYGHELGNHLGDWEHNMVRFKDGSPTHVWYSQHEYGEAFSIHAVQTIGGAVGSRPISYSAKGSHANYAFVGKHDLHDGEAKIPKNVVFDYTSRGLLWDPTLSAFYYTYSLETEKFTPVAGDGDKEPPVNYLYFNGKWGDQEYTDDMPEQSSFQGFHKWTGGPQGPLFKHLDREGVCWPNGAPCVMKTSI